MVDPKKKVTLEMTEAVWDTYRVENSRLDKWQEKNLTLHSLTQVLRIRVIRYLAVRDIQLINRNPAEVEFSDMLQLVA